MEAQAQVGLQESNREFVNRELQDFSGTRVSVDGVQGHGRHAMQRQLERYCPRTAGYTCLPGLLFKQWTAACSQHKQCIAGSVWRCPGRQGVSACSMFGCWQAPPELRTSVL